MTPADEKPAPTHRRPPAPVNVVDGMPDRSERPRLWKYLLLAGVFAAWIGFLIYCQLAS